MQFLNILSFITIDFSFQPVRKTIDVGGVTVVGSFGPAVLAKMSFQCRYLAGVDVSSAPFKIQMATASDSRVGYGSLLDSFDLNLYSDSDYSTEIGAGPVFVGQMVYVSADFSVATLSAAVEFFVESCDVILGQVWTISVVKGNCYAGVLNSAMDNAGNVRKQTTSSRFHYQSFGVQSDVLTPSSQKVTCKLRLCKKNSLECAPNDTCPADDKGYNYSLTGH